MSDVVIRFKFYKKDGLKYLSHLDIARMIIRALNRAGFNLIYSQGYNPRPKVSFSNPTPLGLESLAEYGDVFIEGDVGEEDFKKRINMELRREIQVTEAGKVQGKADSLMSRIDIGLYSFTLDTGVSVREQQEKLYKEVAGLIKKSDFSDSIFKIRQEALKEAPNIILLKLFGYAKIFKGKGNSIFKFNNFYQFLKELLGKYGIKVKDVKKEELFVIKGDELKTPVEII